LPNAKNSRRKNLPPGGAGFDLLSARHPVLLLPVRLETRFAWMNAGRLTFDPDPLLKRVLLVRVYPDEIHEDAHDPQLTADETDALIEFRKKLVTVRDLLPLQNAWKALAARVGPTRAEWIGEAAISLQKPGAGRRASPVRRSRGCSRIAGSPSPSWTTIRCCRRCRSRSGSRSRWDPFRTAWPG
jgi:hypothetical protein